MKMSTSNKYIKVDIDLSVHELIKLISKKFSKDCTILTKGKIINNIEEYYVYVIFTSNYEYHQIENSATSRGFNAYRLLELSECAFKITSEEFEIIKNRYGPPFEMLKILFDI